MENLRTFDIGYNLYEIGTDETVSIKVLVEMIKNLTKNKVTKLNFGKLKYRKNEIMNSVIDNSKIKELGWLPSYSLLSGLGIVINQMRKEL
jgi:nucleoside-diphosphate-sugar epimerase